MRRWAFIASWKTAAGWSRPPRTISIACHLKRQPKRIVSATHYLQAWVILISMLSPSARPRRGEIWRVDLGDGKKHWVVVVSIDARNLSDRTTSVLAVPFGSYGGEGPTTIRMEPGETGLPAPSFLKAHFVQVVAKNQLSDRLPRVLSQTQMRRVVAMINRAIDPDATYDPGH